ncbi:unnamed protein product [Mytilus coruscus]|uniref:Uncharacterized protein n=1 Tax=Mytilus coruscus TaxID=42192 RepID=A0A6J8AB78_MYTCO|nr:unnamed protein product [Mytilus coruscus]
MIAYINWRGGNKSSGNVIENWCRDEPDSKTFDLTLMTTLLRNLTSMTPPFCGFEHLPPATETTTAADLARLKHYRNNLSHLDDSKIDISYFNIAWNDITSAIERLGGEQMKQECDRMKTKPLDQTNKEILMVIKNSCNEIRELKESIESLKLLHIEIKKSHALLQENHAAVTKAMEEHYISQKDTVPWNIRVRINDTITAWKETDDKTFINTRAAQCVLKCIQENDCVTITGSSGVGKMSTLRHTVIQLAAEDYDVILVTEPGDIVRFNNPYKKTLFCIDDLCGNFSVDQSDIKRWEPIIKNIKQILNEKQTKILAACRLQVYQDEKFDALSVFKSCVCNMLSENMCLSKIEKQSIAEFYLQTKASAIGDIDDSYDCFPLLCKLCYDNPELNVTEFFQNPYSVYEAEIDNLLKKGYFTKYCALALCVMFNNKLNAKLLTEDIDEITKTIIENTCESCKLDRGTSRLVLKNELDLLTHTFIKKEHNVYKTIHDKIFDFLAFYFGQTIFQCLIKNADNGLIKTRFLLEKRDDMDQLITVIPQEYQQIYIQRITEDWSKGNVQDVFNNINMRTPQFRQKYLRHLNTLNISYQKKLANICDKRKLCKNFSTRFDDTYDTALLHCCDMGDISLIKWCCNHGADVNRCSYKGQSPVMIGCAHGHTEIVKMLLDRRADFHKCDSLGESSVMKACEHGHTEILKMLLDKEGDCNKCDNLNRSPVMKACSHGHEGIVKMMLDKGADFDKCDSLGVSPVMTACEHGHTGILKMLLDRGADRNKCDNLDRSPVMKACIHGRIEIVKMMLDRRADFNKCDSLRRSPLFMSCKHGHTHIVRMLLDREADYNKCNSLGQSPVMEAYKDGQTEILKMLLDRGADYNKCDDWDQSPVMKACKHGHTEILTMLLDRGVDYNKCDSLGESPVMKACEHGHIEILAMLLEQGVDYNKCNNLGGSPVMKACEHGHIETVKMLLDRGADYNKCDSLGESPVMKACEHGHTEILKMLLDRDVDCSICDSLGKSLVYTACKHGHTEILKMLLDKGADYDKCDKWDRSPVMKACRHGHSEILDILLDRGADYNKCDCCDRSPLLLACIHGHTDILKMLLDRGADYNKYDNLSEPPIMKACEHGHIEILAMLLEQGVDYNKCNNLGGSPVMKACEHGHIETVKMLLDREQIIINVIAWESHL